MHFNNSIVFNVPCEKTISLPIVNTFPETHYHLLRSYWSSKSIYIIYIVTVGNCQHWQKRAKELSRASHLAPKAKGVPWLLCSSAQWPDPDLVLSLCWVSTLFTATPQSLKSCSAESFLLSSPVQFGCKQTDDGARWARVQRWAVAPKI